MPVLHERRTGEPPEGLTGTLVNPTLSLLPATATPSRDLSCERGAAALGSRIYACLTQLFKLVSSPNTRNDLDAKVC